MAYQSASSPSIQYQKTIENVFAMKQHNDKRQEIKDIINKEIAEHQSDLAQVKSYIEKVFQKTLSSIDDCYIEKKYVKYCSRFWLQETVNFLKNKSESKSPAVINTICNSLDGIQNLSDIPSPLNRLPYCILLMDHYKFVKKRDEHIFVNRFKKECWEQIVAFSYSAEKELLFLKAFVNFLSFLKGLQSISKKLKLKDFCRGVLSLHELVNNIMTLEVAGVYGENVNVLQQATQGLKDEEDLFLKEKFIEVIGAYIKPVRIQVRRIDDRLVVEVYGKHIVVSEIICQLENILLENQNTEEVRFVGADIIHIDVDLNNKAFHGKNLVILTKIVKVHGKIIWDVSGIDNKHIYSNNAGTEENGHGKQGKDGYAGESGGNVLVLSEKITNSENFTIISNGGNGSKGQDGGNGKDGENGKGLTNAEFDEKFPPVAHFNSQRFYNILKVMQNIKEASSEIKTVWCTNGSRTIQGIIQHIEGLCDYAERVSDVNTDEAPSYDLIFVEFKENIFIESTTNQGNQITFSFERGGFSFTACQAFFLYKGSSGQPGKHGGEYGFGGQGGYAGQIIVNCIENGSQENSSILKKTIQGKEGEKGQGGLYGNHGKNAPDLGYMDYSVSQFFAEKWPKHFGRDQSSKCTIEYYGNNASDRVWCPYYKKYAKIIASNIGHKKQTKYEERKNSRQNSERQQHARAVRKKNVSQSSILANYSHILSSIESSVIRNLQCELESTRQRALQAINTNQEQQKTQTTESRIKRHYPPYQKKNKHYNNTLETPSNSDSIQETIDVESVIDNIQKEPLLLGKWFQLQKVELSLSKLNQLFSVFEKLNCCPPENNTELQVIEKLLLEKYRLATLQEIAKQLPTYQKVTHNVELSPESAAKFLVEVKESDTHISHAVLGTLDQYLYADTKEQHVKISKFCTEELLKDTENKALKYSIRAFVLEVGKLDEEHTDVKQYYDEYNEYQDKQMHKLQILFDAFKSELSQPRHADIFDLWIKSAKDESLMSKVEEKLKEDKFLKALYERLNNQLKLEYDWNKCCKNQTVFKKFIYYIQEKGLFSGSYRELLAYIFGVNIRLYVDGEDNRLFLRGDHNSSSNQIIYMLCKENKFIKLSIDKNYLELEEERKMNDCLYAQIFAKIKSFKQKQEFDDYLKTKSFLSNACNSGDEQYFNEEEDVSKIIEYFSVEEKELLKERLHKLTFQYIGQSGILHNLLKRFSSEGRHVSCQELHCLVNSILTMMNEDRSEINTFCWIIAAYSQRDWIGELILLQLEGLFKKQLPEKSEWREYLFKIDNKDILQLFKMKIDEHKTSNSVSAKCVGDILRLLSNIPNETVNLEGLELSTWPYALKEKYWSCKLFKLVERQNGDISAASFYLLSIENIFGSFLVEKFVQTLQKKKQELRYETLNNILSYFHNEKWILSEDILNTLNICNIDEWAQKMQQKFAVNKEERKIKQLVEIIKDNANTSKKIVNQLPKIMLSIENIDKYVIAGKPVNSFTIDDIKKWVENKGKQDVKKEEMLAVIERAIVLTKNIKLRDTQKLTVLALLSNDRSTLAQVSTGEGKSLIVVALSIMKALYEEKVDVITSSFVLAKRDAEDNKDVYNLFGVNVSHNCSEDIEKRKEAYSGNRVVYGDLSNFQRDYLLDKFYGKNIFGDRNFNNVIVDEVDSMLLDKGNNMLYLSHDLAWLDKLESVYIYIWQWINRPALNGNELWYAFDSKSIKEAVINDLYGLIKIEDIEKLGSELSEQHRNIIWERLIKAEILDDQGKLLKEKINTDELKKVFSPEFSFYIDRLHYLLKECIEREKCIHVPKYLRSFIERHLESWINSAKNAFFMKTGEDYVVDVDKTGSSPDRNPNITILDRDTGTDQANSQWDEALHQFLQLKHGCKLSLQSLKAVFTSNVSFFKLYNNLYGLTGTLGSKRERDLLQEMHEVDFVTIPPAKSKQFHEEKPIICTDKKEWLQRIYKEAKKLTEEEKRSVLIICETINDVETLHMAFGGKDARHVHTYTRDYEEYDKGFEIVQGHKELGPAQIIIATNLAGRGTDIKITDELRKARGVHVCLTYLPSNVRVEQQAFGRAARCGDQGSGQLIILELKGKENCNSKILHLKKERYDYELERISDIKAYYDTQITMEERYFKIFKDQYEQLKKDLNDKKVPNEVEEILLQSCLEKWVFWLDEHNKYVDLTGKDDKNNLRYQLDEFIAGLKNLGTGYEEPPKQSFDYNTTSWLAWVKENPAQMIKLAKFLSQNEKYKNAHKNAIELFNEVIKKEPCFSEAAHYYKAFALIKQVDLEQMRLKKEGEEVLGEFKQELQEAARLFEKHSRFAINTAGIIGKIKKNNNESIIQINAFEEQQKSFADLYWMFSRSIDDIFGHIITPQFLTNVDIKEELAESLYEDLLEKGVLEKPRLEDNIPEEELKVISSSYGISDEDLKRFLSKYKGKGIDENTFRKELKKEIELPSREVFWESLIQGKILKEEVKYVVINNKKLKEIDPSLMDYLNEKVEKGTLEKQTLEHGDEELFLNEEQITQQKMYGNAFKKVDFIEIAGQEKYKVLKGSGVILSSRKARIDQSKMESFSFPCYDSITLEDLSKVNITKSECELILVELAKQNIIARKNGLQNNDYGLMIKFDEIKNVELSSFPVYESVIKGLLNTCFTYKIALQKISEQLQENKFPICLQLIRKPHKMLAFELLEQKILRPTMVAPENENIEEILKLTYNQTQTKAIFKHKFSQTKIIPKGATESLFGFLIKKGWITKYIPRKSIKDEGIGALNKENIKNAIGSLSEDLYCITCSDKRKTPLNLQIKPQSIDKTVEKILDNQLQLTKKDVITNIVSTLKRSRSSLKTLKVPETKLKPLNEFYEGSFANIGEVHVFFLNGLDTILQLEEKKWTQEMMVNTIKVTTLGLTQITIGTFIELYSVGTMTHVGGAFVKEGVNDLFFAAGSLRSGLLSWDDYKQHKLESLIITAATAGIGAYLSRGTKVSRFGYKLAGPNFEFGKKVAEMAGNELIQNVGWKLIATEFAKRITLKTIEGLALGLANAGVDTIIENYLQAVCESIASVILSNIEEIVEKSDISISLEKAYGILGRDKARNVIDNLTRNCFTKETCLEELLPIANIIASSVSEGIREAVKKRDKTSNKLLLPINAIGSIVVWSERATQIANITIVTNKFLDHLDQEIKSKLTKLEQNVDPNQKQKEQEDCEIFKQEIIDQWKSLLREKATKMIERHIVSPILKKGANHLVRYVGYKIQETYQSYKESGYFERFEELKQEHKEKLQSEQQECSNTSKTKDHITKNYHAELRKLMIKTKNPNLLADIVRENIPMDMTCAAACTEIVFKILKQQDPNISKLVIIVKGERGIRQEFSSMSDESKGIKLIPIELKNNHFEFCESKMTEHSGESNNNNCLYDALSEAIPELRNVMSAEVFRNKAAYYIKHDKTIRYHIQQGWHQLPISLGTYGGAKQRKRVNLIYDESSSTETKNTENTETENKDHRYRVREVQKHLQARFIRFFRMAGIIQRASEQTNIPRDQVVDIGASLFYDQHSNKGKEIHAAHVNRFGNIHPEILKHEQLCNEICNFLGHTQNVPKYANEWHGVGGGIDNFQSRNLRELGRINFAKGFTTDDESIIRSVRNDFITVLDDRISSGQLGDREKSELLRTKTALSDLSIESMFKKGRNGYYGKGMERYWSRKV